MATRDKITDAFASYFGVLHLARHWLLFLCTLNMICCASSDYLINSFTQSVGAGNYTYYKLSKEGNVQLVLNSIDGDADLFISDITLYPDYKNYKLQATSCGEDIIDVPASFTRPIGVGIYGHSSHTLSRFRLDVYVEETGHKSATGSLSSSHTPFQKANKVHTGKEEEESILWTIFVGILKIIFDILLWDTDVYTKQRKITSITK